MAQKVIKIGKSTGITIPKDILEELKWKIGDIVYMHVDYERKQILVNKDKKRKIERLSEGELKILNWIENFEKNYRPALEKLENKNRKEA